MFFTLPLITVYAAATSALAVPSIGTFLSRTNLTANLESMAGYYHWRNITSGPLTFLGVDCYHLLPDTVTLETCQPLFAKLVNAGSVYEKYRLYDGWSFRAVNEPCFIKIENPIREQRRERVSLSMADILMYATEVLRTCQEPGTGGSNTFKGAWRVVVTKHPVRFGKATGRLSGEQGGLQLRY